MSFMSSPSSKSREEMQTPFPGMGFSYLSTLVLSHFLLFSESLISKMATLSCAFEPVDMLLPIFLPSLHGWLLSHSEPSGSSFM
jgi:hypothetical protein